MTKSTNYLLAGLAAAGLLGAVPSVSSSQEPATPTPASAAVSEGHELPVHEIPNLGEAAEFYFSADGQYLIGNAKRDGDQAHHTYITSVDGSKIWRVNDKGQDACSHFFPDGKKIVWTSTRDHLDLPPGDWSAPKDYPQGAELYISNPDGSDLKQLTHNKVYEAEVSVSPDGQWILFSRQTDGKLDLWRMRPDGSEEQQITHTDDWQEGGSFYLPDSETIVFRAWKREDEGMRGMPMQLFTIKHDGTGLTQITKDPGMNWSPHPAPDGVHVAYVRMLMPEGGGRPNFEIFVIDRTTGEKRQLTFNPAFDGFPSFSPDGKWLAFASSRDAKPGERTLRTYLMDISSLGYGKR